LSTKNVYRKLQLLEWYLLYVLQMSKPRTFQELVTKAHEMGMIVISRHGKSSSSFDSKKDKDEFKKNLKSSKSSSKESTVVSIGSYSEFVESPRMRPKRVGSPRTLERSILH